MADFNHGHAPCKSSHLRRLGPSTRNTFGSQGFCFLLVFSGLVSMLHKFLDDGFFSLVNKVLI